MSWYLDGEDLHGHILAQELRLPHAAKAPPGLYLNELQGLVSQNGGRRGRSRVLRKGKGVCGGEEIGILTIKAESKTFFLAC